MNILGVDPGLHKTGYGLVKAGRAGRVKFVEAGVIRTSPDDNISDRVAIIYSNLTDIVEEYRPEVIVLEKLYSHYKHPVTSILMGHARGIVCLVCGKNKMRLVNYPATRIKKAITGNGRAGKRQVQGMVRALLGMNSFPEPFDVSDALAMAISYVRIEGEK